MTVPGSSWASEDPERLDLQRLEMGRLEMGWLTAKA